MVINLSRENSILCDWIAELRDEHIQRDRMRFRRNLERVGEIAGYEISRQLSFEEKEIQTQLGIARSRVLASQPVLATILRAGIPIHQGLLNVFDKADNAFIGAYRKHDRDGSFEISLNYISCPDLEGRVLILPTPCWPPALPW
jgi:uracil phosphoribosyltransferase